MVWVPVILGVSFFVVSICAVCGGFALDVRRFKRRRKNKSYLCVRVNAGRGARAVTMLAVLLLWYLDTFVVVPATLASILRDRTSDVAVSASMSVGGGDTEADGSASPSSSSSWSKAHTATVVLQWLFGVLGVAIMIGTLASLRRVYNKHPGRVPIEWWRWDGDARMAPQLPLHSIRVQHDTNVDGDNNAAGWRAVCGDGRIEANTKACADADVGEREVLSLRAASPAEVVAAITHRRERLRQRRSSDVRVRARAAPASFTGRPRRSPAADILVEGETLSFEEEDTPARGEANADAVDPNSLAAQADGGWLYRDDFDDVSSDNDDEDEEECIGDELGIRLRSIPAASSSADVTTEATSLSSSSSSVPRAGYPTAVWVVTTAAEATSVAVPQSASSAAASENVSFVVQRVPQRYCEACSTFKPPRTHHCSVCQRCVARMDHHCLLVGNCIGADNAGDYTRFLARAAATLVLHLVLCVAYITAVVIGTPAVGDDILATMLSVGGAGMLALIVTQLRALVWRASRNLTYIEHLYPRLVGGGAAAFDADTGRAVRSFYSYGSARLNMQYALGIFQVDERASLWAATGEKVLAHLRRWRQRDGEPPLRPPLPVDQTLDDCAGVAADRMRVVSTYALIKHLLF